MDCSRLETSTTRLRDPRSKARLREAVQAEHARNSERIWPTRLSPRGWAEALLYGRDSGRGRFQHDLQAQSAGPTAWPQSQNVLQPVDRLRNGHPQQDGNGTPK